MPQAIYFILAFISLGIAIGQHGQPKKGKHNAWTSVISFILTTLLLMAGGFFD